MRFLDEAGICVVDLLESALDRMRALTRKVGRRETGGILIGCYDSAHRTALVSCITDAPRDSTSGPSAFQRGTQGLNALLARAWRRGLYYLGEWHSHPEINPKASSIDAMQMASFARTPDLRCPEPLLLVAGTGAVSGDIACYIYRANFMHLLLAAEDRNTVGLNSLKT